MMLTAQLLFVNCACECKLEIYTVYYVCREIMQIKSNANLDNKILSLEIICMQIL